MRNKTDRNDARGIAKILRTGSYSRVHVKSIESHHIRALLSSRKAVLNKCVDLENELHGLLKVSGIRLAIKVPHGAYDSVVRPLIRSRRIARQGAFPCLKRVRCFTGRSSGMVTNKGHCQADPVCQRLMTVPGVWRYYRANLQGCS
jgi:Transposase and inactivated derivatives